MYSRSIDVDERAAGRRVDVYLAARFSSFSRTTIAQHIRAGRVLMGGRRLKPASILALGETLEIFIPGIAPERPPPPLPPVLYEDDRLIAFHKPAGMLAHPSGERFVWGLIGLARRARPNAHIDLVHRLDRETSGVMVMTKDAEANVILKKSFMERTVEKEYHAIARGEIDWSVREVQAPIGEAVESAVRLRRAVTPTGKHAHTTVRVLSRMSGYTLVSCKIHTGRTHQIRVHMEHIGHPLLGDKLYGQPDEVFLSWLQAEKTANNPLRQRLLFPRHALHAQLLRLPHPDDGQPFGIEAPLPADMRAIVDGKSPTWIEEAPIDDPAG
ncbi:MAG: RluA family pseudouridine synthase [Myxococcota bacterium]